MNVARTYFWIFCVTLIALTPGWRLEAAIYDPDIPAALRTVNCTNQSTFTTALAGAIPGDHILLADGTYTFGTLTKNGTSTNPIVIEALNNAGAIINSTNTQHILNSSYVILNGLRFTAPGGSQQMFEINDSRYIRVTRCSFDGSGLGDTVAVVDNTASSSTASHHNRYDHCRWYGKTNLGEYLKWSQTGSSNAISLYDRIDHNFFDGRALTGGNGGESTRMGVGVLSLIPSFMVCEYNLYKECDGDSEFISIKTSCATIRFNTAINCYGTISLRQGTNNQVYNNIVLTGSQAGNGGIKITGFYHSVHDNYIEGGTDHLGLGALVLQGADINSVDSEGGHGVIDTLVLTNNVLYNNKYGLEVGCKYTPYMPRNCIIANNKVQQSSGPCYNITGEGTNNVWFGNTARLTGSATAGSSNGVSVTTTNIDYAYYRSLALTTNEVGPNAVDPNYAPSVSLTANGAAGGWVSPTSTNVVSGGSASFVITASNYYRIATLTTNGTAVTGMTFDNNSTATNFTWSNVQYDGTLAATFTNQVTTNAAAPVPYSWLAQYGLTNSGATFDQAAVADQDSDGLSAWQEYIAGTDPTNAASCFTAAQNTRNTITWSAVSGRVYSVYWTTNLMNGFQPLETNILYPQGSYTNATPDPKANYYRIKVRMQ